MSQLQTDQEISGSTEVPFVSRHQPAAQIVECVLVGLVDQKLVGIGPPILPNSHRLPAPDELGPTPAKVLPAPAGQEGRLAVLSSVPALHGEDAEAVSDNSRADLEGLGEG